MRETPIPSAPWQHILLLASQQQKTLAVAESCTGGGIGKAITDIPGSSHVFLGGVIAYANEVKTNLLGVPQETLSRCGAVSFETCEAMLKGIARLFHPSYAIAVTGIAGPEGGTPHKPVGTVFCGIRTSTETVLFHCLFQGERWAIREHTIAFVGWVVFASLKKETSYPHTFLIETRHLPHEEKI
ncbi:MAG: CinA family protein [Brevinematales bacterium]|nr:CinA family protein [Brevinematales bacterium]